MKNLAVDFLCCTGCMEPMAVWHPTILFYDVMVDGSIPPMLVVYVNGLPKRLWSDSKDGSAPVESVFIQEVIPHVDKIIEPVAGGISLTSMVSAWVVSARLESGSSMQIDSLFRSCRRPVGLASRTARVAGTITISL